MFTGIVEAMGEVVRFTQDRLVLGCHLDEIRPGDSIAVDGCCLTIVGRGAGSVELQLLEETKRKTTLGELIPGRRVNLERGLQAGGRFGGHFVTGHIDCVGTIIGRRRVNSDDVIEVRGPAFIMAYLVTKGSIAVDGVSLTLVDVSKDSFTFHMIGYTREHTTLGMKRVGDKVNIEADILAKYVEKFVIERGAGLTEEKLRSSGIID